MVNGSCIQFDYDDSYLKVSAEEGADDVIEFPKEEDGNVLFTFIHSQFPCTIGLKYKDGSGDWKMIRPVNDVLNAPKDGWGCRIYYIALSSDENNNERKDIHQSNEQKKEVDVKNKNQNHGVVTDQKIHELMAVNIPLCTFLDKKQLEARVSKARKLGASKSSAA